MLLRGRGLGDLSFGDDFTVDYGGGDLTGSDLTAAETLNSSLPDGASSSSISSSSGGFSFGGALSSVGSILGGVAHLFSGSGSSGLSASQLAALQAQQSASRTNTLLIAGGVGLAGLLAYMALRRRPAR